MKADESKLNLLWKNHRYALIFLTAQALLLLFALWRGGNLKPVVVNDSEDFIRLSRLPIFSNETLTSIRTLGYVAFLKCFGEPFRAVPVAHFLAFFVACLVFYSGLISVGISSTAAALLTSSLYYGNVIHPLGIVAKITRVPFIAYGEHSISLILSDWLALCGILGTSGFLLLVIANPRSKWRWASLAGGAFCTYQMRAAYLYIIFAIPVMWALFGYLRDRKVAIRSYAATFAITLLAPYFVFCAFRYFTVGHFGLVSAGGANMVGLTGHLISPETIARLPASLQGLAEEIAMERDRKNWPPVFSSFSPNLESADGSYCILASLIANPIAKRYFRDDGVAANRALSAISWSMVRQRPFAYLRWLVRAFIAAIWMHEKLLSLQLLGWAAALFSLGVLLFRWGRTAFIPRSEDMFLLLLVIGFSGIVFTMQVGLVLLVAPPHPRYIEPAGAFLPLIPAAFAYLVARSTPKRSKHVGV